MEFELGVLGGTTTRGIHGAGELQRGLSGRLLTVLAVEGARPVRDDVLLERLWPAGPPPNALASLRNVVARLRRTTGAASIERVAKGYRLGTGASRTDVDTFDELVTSARMFVSAGDTGAALRSLVEALGLIRGRPFDDVADEPWAMPAVEAISERIAQAQEFWAELMIEDGRAIREITRLREAAVARPHREIRWRQLIETLAAAGRRTEALRAADDARRALAEYGVVPGADLLAVERRVIGPRPDHDNRVGRQVPIRRGPIVGRAVALADLFGVCNVTWLEGEAGAGKTRLLAELADRSVSFGETVAYAACQCPETSASQLIASLLAAVRQREPGDDCAADLTALIEGAPGDGRSVPPDARRLRMVADFESVLADAASGAPLTVVVDDVHWADDSAVRLLVEAVDAGIAGVRWVFATRDRRVRVRRLLAELERRVEVRHVTLGALTDDDLRELVALLDPDINVSRRDRLVEQVMAATAGHPLIAAELIAHRIDVPDLDDDPPRLDAIVARMMSGLAEDDRLVVEMLSVAEGACPIALIAEALRRDATCVLVSAELLETEGLVAPVVADQLQFRHDLVRRAVARQISPSKTVARRRDLIAPLHRDPRYVVRLADQFLRLGDLLDVDGQADRDRAVIGAIERLLRQLDHSGAHALAERYLDAVGEDVFAATGLAARLKAVTALIAFGEADRGRRLLGPLAELALRSGDAISLADAVLALGPVALGGRRRPELVAQAERIAAALPDDEHERRAQLLCWAAHHLNLQGDRAESLRLLGACDEIVAARPNTMLRGLALAVRAQAESLVEGDVGCQRRLVSELAELAERTGDETSNAGARVLSVGLSFALGTLADVRARRDDLVEIGQRFPRQDLRWWPLAIDASIAIAAGDFDAAEPAIVAAEVDGADRGLEIASRIALLQRSQMMLLTGEFAQLRCLLEPRARADDASATLLAMYASACVESGALDQTDAVADRLASIPNVLASSGIMWPQLAMHTADVAFAVDHTALATTVWRELVPHSGSGLAMSGAGYFGAVDRSLGLIAAVIGTHDEALRLLRSAEIQEVHRGAGPWAERARSALEHVRQRGGHRRLALVR